jgi:hypothetical protein
MTMRPLRSVGANFENFLERPFGRLLRLFVGRIFYGDSDSELTFSMGLLLALLPVPGGFYAVLLFEKYSTLLQWMRGERVTNPIAAAMPEQYFFIVLSMVVTGVIVVWRWDSIFPDRRDYVNLVPLPLHSRSIFVANFAALLVVALILAVDLNAASALLFPLSVGASVDSFRFFAQFAWVHGCDVLMASLFGFFSVFLVVGLLMSLLPHSTFRRVSLYARSAIVACWVAILATSFAVPPGLRGIPGLYTRFLPPVWFLGLAQSVLNPGTDAYYRAMGRIAVIASELVLLYSLAIYTISYRNCFMRIAETVGQAGRTARKNTSRIFRALDGTVLRSPFQRAGYRFVIKTLLRSEQHGLMLGAFVGLGTVIASQFLFSSLNSDVVTHARFPSPELLAIPLILSYCIIVGLRLAFELPTELQANWIFRFCVDKHKHEARSLGLKAILSFVLPWVWLFAAPIYAYFWGWWSGIFQAVVVTVWSFLLAEILLLKFRKLPFTCPYPQFRHSAVVLALSYVLGFFVFVILTAHLLYWSRFTPVPAIVLMGIAVISWYVLYRIRKDVPDVENQITFDADSASGFELLDLARGS